MDISYMSTKLNWHSSIPKSPINGDLFFSAEDSIVIAFIVDKWYNFGSLEEDTEEKVIMTIRDYKVGQVITKNN